MTFSPLFLIATATTLISTSFPTRRSSDLAGCGRAGGRAANHGTSHRAFRNAAKPGRDRGADRKSTRLNSSHEWISYAVFCLKKKKQQVRKHGTAQRTARAVCSIFRPRLQS